MFPRQPTTPLRSPTLVSASPGMGRKPIRDSGTNYSTGLLMRRVWGKWSKYNGASGIRRMSRYALTNTDN